MAKKKKWKKVLSLLMALLVICLPLASCQNGEKEDSASSEASGESESSEGTEPLRVVTDLGWWAKWYSGKSEALEGQKVFQQIIDHYGGTPNGMKVELEVLPTTESGEYESALTHLRTEIMTGGGPDVFLLSGFGSCTDGLPDDTLFPNPEHAMCSNLFLKLDDYLENAQFMEFDLLDPVVMAAGRNEDGQFILPMLYNLPMGVLSGEGRAIPADWQEAVSSQDIDIRRLYAQAVRDFSPGFRELAFERIADNVEEELLLDKDELFQRTKEAVQLYQEYRSGQLDSAALEYEAQPWGLNYKEFLSFADEDPNAKFTYFAPRNSQGGITAAIETWCAVNRNTKHPEDAFFITDILLTATFLKLDNTTWNPSSRDPTLAFFGHAGYGCIPVHTNLLSSASSTFRNSKIPSDQRNALKEARGNITYAYLTSNADRELNRMFRTFMEMVKSGENPDEAAIRKETDKCYSTVKMMLAES